MSDPTITVIVQEPRVTVSGSGARGPQGPQGPPGSSTSYEHVQALASTTWTVSHNLGFRPAVEVTTTGGAVVFAEVLHLSTTVAQLSFLTPMAGRARFT